MKKWWVKYAARLMAPAAPVWWSAMVRARYQGGGPALRNMLLISDGQEATSEQQFAPFWRYAAALRRDLGLVVHHREVAASAMAAGRVAGYDYVGVKLSFRTPADEAIRTVRQLSAALKGSAARLVYFDGDDDLCVQWPEVLGEVDAYVKKHVFSDPKDYEKRYVGKSNLTDAAAREDGYPFAENAIPAAGPVAADDLSRIVLGWNIALDDKIERCRAEFSSAMTTFKDIDVLTRCYVSPDVWIHPHRQAALDAITRMESRFSVRAPRERVTQQEYNQELLRARICVSPFGYGELCWRDFEAILAGCLLIKPDMSHLSTYPDVFVAGETYAPVRRDWSDLTEVCARYLDDEAARLTMVSRAREVLLAGQTGAAFVARVKLLLTDIDGKEARLRSA